jgi:hypothetical protein
MALASMKSKSTSKKAKGLGRAVHDDTVMPFDIEMIGAFCLPDEFTLSSPIMPEGFITYTNLMPSADSKADHSV